MHHDKESVEGARHRVEEMDWKPRNVVWELTLACNLRCRHCGSSAGRPRAAELTTDECLSVAGQLAGLGADLVTLSGGEPTLRSDWDRIAAALTRSNVRVNMVTNGVYGARSSAREIAARAVEAGMCNVGLSIDGPQMVHETIRGRGTWRTTLDSVAAFRAAGLPVGVLTTVNRLNFHLLEEIREIAMAAGATMWRLQLAKPMGNLRQKDDWVVTPRDVLSLVPRLAALKKQDGIHVAVGDSIGYFGPYDKTLRGWGWRQRTECWKGCQAGMQALGIESDGGVKGCLSLQAKQGDRDPFVEGNLRELSLADLWHRPGVFAYNRDFSTDSLTGFCGRCRYMAQCRGGARCVSSAFTGLLNEDPYCYYRVAALEHRDAVGAITKAAASAAAALVLSTGMPGCWLDSNSPAEDVVAPGPDNCCQPEYGIDVVPQPDLQPQKDAEPDNCCQPEYGIDVVPQPDLQPLKDAEPDFCCPEYGVPPDVQPQKDAQPDNCCPEYGVPPDVKPADVVPDEIDCSQVCCECDYGIIPDELLEKCCNVKPDVAPQPDVTPQPDVAPADAAGETKDAIDCSDVCCMCEYGIIPEDVYKACCEDPCANACCDCDYGEPPPPQCCPK